ncbi:hypothetical protein [Streptomyces sp. NPDC002057]|uniref:hypothetical protein n=1 Tax=Streptomyces sp. NPDC002057 TaxID=3154664 RepID=UPI0033315617
MRLAVELAWPGPVALAAESPAEPGAVVGFLSLAAGTEGTVERVDVDRSQSQEVREYERLKSLLDDFGHQMPSGSRGQLEERIGALEPAWLAHQERGLLATLRVRLDNGFVLRDMPEDVFTAV